MQERPVCKASLALAGLHAGSIRGVRLWALASLCYSLLDWQKRYGTEEACARALAQQRWPEGFRCPRCGHDHGYAITTRHSYECAECHYQASLTAGALL